MPFYTYLAADRATGRIIAELPLSGVSYDLRVNDAAVMSATLPADAASGVMEIIGSARTSVYALRGDRIMFGGVMWGRKYTASSRSYALDFADPLSYLDAHIHITADLVYKQADQLAIARSLVNYANTKQGANIDPVFLGSTVSGVKRDRTYLGIDKAPVGQRLRELGAVEGGFDFRFEHYWDGGQVGGTLRRALTLGYPTLGRGLPNPAVFEADSDLTDYEWDEDGASMASTVYATGAVAEGAPATALAPEFIAEDPSAKADGYPRMEAVMSFTDITTPAVLASHAKGKLTLARRPLQSYTLTVAQPSTPEGAAPEIGEYLPGDSCLIRFSRGDGLWRYGAEVRGMVTGITVAVGDEHNESASVSVVPYSTVPGRARL